jgi:hypothetical protein
MIDYLRVGVIVVGALIFAGCASGSGRVEKVSSSEVMTPDELKHRTDLAGKTIMVEGTCAGYVGAIDPPPVSRSDWLLKGRNESIYVVGPAPAGCAGTHGGNLPARIAGEVAVDSLPSNKGYVKRVFLFRSR